VLIAQGGAFGGWALYLHEGRLKYCYSLFGMERYYAEGETAVEAGSHQVRMEFTYDGGGVGKGGSVSLYVDGKQVGDGRVEHTVPMIFSADETTDLGYESGTAVAEDYIPATSRFPGDINWVQIDIGEDAEDDDHLLSPEERLRVAMAIQ
jgi:arylsulfatase